MTNNKLLLLIDGANLHGAAKALGFSIDFKKLLSEFRTRGDLLRANYYTALADDDEIFTDCAVDRLARLQRLRGHYKADEVVHRWPR